MNVDVFGGIVKPPLITMTKDGVTIRTSILSEEIVVTLRPFPVSTINKDGAELVKSMFADAETLSKILFENLPALTLAVFVRKLTDRMTNARIDSLTEDRE